VIRRTREQTGSAEGETVQAGRIFASHYQIVICDDPSRGLPDDIGWDDAAISRGVAGDAQTLAFITEADGNDHWVELCVSSAPPDIAEWQRVLVAPFRSRTGRVCIMSVIDDVPVLTAPIEPGDYGVYVAAQNLGVDLNALGAAGVLSDSELAVRRDLEWYRVFIVPGAPPTVGRLKDC
jgi:hypothetical protein